MVGQYNKYTQYVIACIYIIHMQRLLISSKPVLDCSLRGNKMWKVLQDRQKPIQRMKTFKRSRVYQHLAIHTFPMLPSCMPFASCSNVASQVDGPEVFEAALGANCSGLLLDPGSLHSYGLVPPFPRLSMMDSNFRDLLRSFPFLNQWLDSKNLDLGPKSSPKLPAQIQNRRCCT